MFGKPPESPCCAAGLLPLQSMLPCTVLVWISLPSGSAVALFVYLKLPPTSVRKKPPQQVCRSSTVALPPTDVDSTVKKPAVSQLYPPPPPWILRSPPTKE